MEIVNENSSIQIKKDIFGDYSEKIKTFCTMTPENPKGKEFTSEENNKLIKRFKEYIEQLNIYYTKIHGISGSREHSFMMYNISLNDAEKLSVIFDQQSFIFGKLTPKDGINISYYEWDGKSYRLLDIDLNVNTLNDFEYFYSKHKDFKYQFPFNFGESVELDNADISYLEKCCDESLTMKERANNRAHFYRKGNLY